MTSSTMNKFLIRDGIMRRIEAKLDYAPLTKIAKFIGISPPMVRKMVYGDTLVNQQVYRLVVLACKECEIEIETVDEMLNFPIRALSIKNEDETP
jgi:Mn-dependent DtxR family transcriptional regulator